MSARLGLARWHMQTMQTSEFLHLLGHSSVSAVIWDVFRGWWHRYISMAGYSLSGWAWLCSAFILLPLRFSYLPGRPSWMCLFDTAHFEFLIESFKNFCKVFCLTLQLVSPVSGTWGTIMLKWVKPGVAPQKGLSMSFRSSEAVSFFVFSLGLLYSLFCIENGENSIQMLSATSHIELEFLTKFLTEHVKISKSVDFAVPEGSVTFQFLSHHGSQRHLRLRVNSSFLLYFLCEWVEKIFQWYEKLC